MHNDVMEYDDTDDSTEEKGGKEQQPSTRSFVWGLIKLAVIAMLIVVPVRLFVMQPFFVRGGSMEPTFHDGDYLIIDEFSYLTGSPDRGDVVVFRYPNDPSQFFIKRIVGLPEETVQITDDGRLVITHGRRVTELPLDTPPSQVTPQTTRLDDDEYFVLGDNREASSDSRRWGPLERHFIIGRAWLRLWPFERAGVLSDDLRQPVGMAPFVLRFSHYV